MSKSALRHKGTGRLPLMATRARRPHSWRRLLRRARDVRRSEGPLAATHKAWARSVRPVYGKATLLELDLVGWSRDLRAMVPIEVRELDSASVPHYLLARPEFAETEVWRRLADGHRCFVTWTRDRITSAVWYRTGCMEIPEVEWHIDLEPQQVYGYDSWTHPDVRGRNIAAARAVTACATLRAAGFRSLVAYVLADNSAGLRPLLKLGFHRVATVGSIRLGVLHFEYSRRERSRTEWTGGRRRHQWAEFSDRRQ
jgi:RimJ/RimL family protein N-acetyltransferase